MIITLIIYLPYLALIVATLRGKSRHRFIVAAVLIALPLTFDGLLTWEARNKVDSICQKEIPSDPLPLEVSGIALANASFPPNFIVDETSDGTSEIGIGATDRFSAVWYEFRQRKAQSSTISREEGPLSCESYDDFESCLNHYSDNEPIYRFTKTQLKLPEYSAAQPIKMQTSRVRVWVLDQGKPNVLSTWTGISATKSTLWILFTLWSDSHIYSCSTENKTFPDWLN